VTITNVTDDGSNGYGVTITAAPDTSLSLYYIFSDNSSKGPLSRTTDSDGTWTGDPPDSATTATAVAVGVDDPDNGLSAMTLEGLVSHPATTSKGHDMGQFPYKITVSFGLLDSADPLGGNGGKDGTHASADNFKVAAAGSTYENTPMADRIDVSQLLVGYNGDTSTVGQYLKATSDGTNTTISIDRDGSGSAFQSAELITLNGVKDVTIDQLMQSHQLLL
jgi:hypothetical protein